MSNNPGDSNESLDEIALGVLKIYDIIPGNISLIQGDSIKTVWKIKTQEKQLCLKRLKQSFDKAQFSVNAQIYIKKSGGNVPGVLLDRSGQPIVQYNDQLFVLYEWVDGNGMNFDNPLDLCHAIQGLASFHIASKGYLPDAGCRASSKLGKWPEQYGSMRNKLITWKETAKSNISQSYYSTYLEYADSMINIGNLALEMLKKSEYCSLTTAGSNSIVLCHQDYGRGNAIYTGRGVFILDLDGVTFDLPARDLRKIIGKSAENKNQWQTATIKSILDWYMKINPLDNNERNVLYIDMLFPHWFFGLVKNLFQAGKSVKSSEIERIARLEESKVPLIKTLLKRSE